MQTFLPYPNFTDSVKVLDNKRLGKQRVEAYQILLCLEKPNRWKNHPAVKMWKGYEPALCEYMNACIDEWISRGFKNTMKHIHLTIVTFPMPHWMGNSEFHASHRSNLLRKYSIYYEKFGWTEPNNLPYIWPV